MAKLEVVEQVVESCTLTGLDREVPKDIVRDIGLAAHYVLERLEFRTDKPAEVFLRDLLIDVKSATGTRAPRNPDPADGPQVKRVPRAKPATPEAAVAPAAPAAAPVAAGGEAPKKKRGRPPKVRPPEGQEAAPPPATPKPAAPTAAAPATGEAPKKKRGRPPKVRPPEGISATAEDFPENDVDAIADRFQNVPDVGDTADLGEDDESGEDDDDEDVLGDDDDKDEEGAAGAGLPDPFNDD